MTGELHDYHYPDRAPWYPRHQGEAGVILKCALTWLLFYYVFLRIGTVGVCTVLFASVVSPYERRHSRDTRLRR
jgi:hypothetical protein